MKKKIFCSHYCATKNGKFKNKRLCITPALSFFSFLSVITCFVQQMLPLPLEILPIILENSQKADVYTCMNVCKSWYSIGSAVYHRTIRLDRDHAQFLELTETVRLDGSKIGDFVKEIFFNTNMDYLQDKSDFHRLIYNLPRLQKIHIEDRYIHHLQTIPKSYVNQIQEINLFACFAGQEIYNSHFSVNIRFSDRITSLKLEDTNLTAMNTKELLESLSKFKYLKQLEITEEEDDDNTHLDLTAVLNACKNLEYVNFASHSVWEIAPSECTYMSTNLKTLILEVNDFTEEHMIYMMDCIPNLKNLRISVNCKLFEEIISSSSKDTLKRFAQYLGRLDKAVVRSEKSAMDEDILVASDNQAVWKFIGDLCNGETTYCDLNIAQEKGLVSTCLKKTRGSLYLDYCIPFSQIMDVSWVDQVDFLTFNNVFIYYYDPEVQDENFAATSLYASLIAPVLKLVKQPTCSVNIKSIEEEFLFKTLQKIKSSPATNVNYGFMKGLTINNDMLHRLSFTYPSLKHLHVDECFFQKEKGKKPNHFIIDLSSYTNVEQLTMNLDTFIGNKNIVRPLYIEMKDTSSSTGSKYYFYFSARNKDTVFQVDKPVIHASFYAVKIALHTQLKQLAFKRSSKELNIN